MTERKGNPTPKDRRESVGQLRVLAARTIRMIEERLPEDLDKDPEIDKTLRMAEEAIDFAAWAWGSAVEDTDPEPRPGDIVQITVGPYKGCTGIAGRCRSSQKYRIYFTPPLTGRNQPAHRVIMKKHLKLKENRQGYDPFKGGK